MNLIYDPSIEVTGYQCVDQDAVDRFLAAHAVESWSSDSSVGAEVLTEMSGRCCYMSFAKPRPGGNSAYLGHIKETGHGSVLEHGVWNFVIWGVSRSFTHELVRHRAGWSYSQLSQRFVDESVCDVIVPHELRTEVSEAWTLLAALGRGFGIDAISEALDQGGHPNQFAGLVWLRSMAQTSEDYKFLVAYLSKRLSGANEPRTEAEKTGLADAPVVLDKTTIRKTARGTGRSVLPNATETKIFCTANARALRHFFELRANRHAEVEARKVAYLLWSTLVVTARSLFGDYTPVSLRDGTYELVTPFKKV
jgi:thymidylate synthase (FAD)